MRPIIRQRQWLFLLVLLLACFTMERSLADDTDDTNNAEDAAMSTPGALESETQSEAREGAVPVSTDCPLDCVNGGECRLGRTSTSTSSQTSSSPDQSSSGNKQGHYCFCPTGFTGIYCEIKFILCQDETEQCFNGDACQRDIDDAGDVFYHCECDTDPTVSNLATREAGRFCENSVLTTYCRSSKDDKKDRDGPYCANSGKCNADKSSCTCPAAWTGEHCEIPVNLQALYKMEHFMDDDYIASQEAVSPAETGKNNRVAYVSLIIIIGTFAAIMITMRHYDAEVRYGRIQLRQDEPQRSSASGAARRKRRPHPMELEMNHMRAPQANGGTPHEVI